MTYFLNQQILDQYFPKVKNCNFVNFDPRMLDDFKGVENYGLSYLPLEDRKNYIIQQSENGPCIVAMLESKPVAIFGCVIIWKGVGEAWSIILDESRRYKIAMSKAAFTFFDIIHILYGLHRTQITVKKNDSRAVAWAKFLGFNNEGLMKAYSSEKEDTYIMGKTYG